MEINRWLKTMEISLWKHRNRRQKSNKNYLFDLLLFLGWWSVKYSNFMFGCTLKKLSKMIINNWHKNIYVHGSMIRIKKELRSIYHSSKILKHVTWVKNEAEKDSSRWLVCIHRCGCKLLKVKFSKLPSQK